MCLPTEIMQTQRGLVQHMSSTVSGFEQLSGPEWQTLCMRVLKQHYGPGNVVDIPDQDRGDGGIEAFTLTGDAFQCYAPENEPLTSAQLKAKHIAKLNADCTKFIENVEKIGAYIPAGLLITKWMLLVPRIATKEVRIRCAELTSAIRAANLPYAASNIVVTAVTLADFDAARQAVVGGQLALLDLPPINDVSFAGLGDARSAIMDGKLSKVPQFASSPARDEIVDRLLKSHLTGKVHREFVSDQYSELSESLEVGLDDLEKRLVLQYSLSAPNNTALLGSVLDDTEQLVKLTLHVSDLVARTIAEGQVAEWLMRCPLDFA